MSKFKSDIKNRRRKLCSGVCDICEKYPASIPWKGDNYCYECFTVLQNALMEETNDKKDKEATQKAEAESEKEQKSVKGNRTYGKKLFEGLLPFAN